MGALLFAAPGNFWSACVAGIFGLILGSFLNVVIHRLPRIMQRQEDDDIATYFSQSRDEARKLGSAVSSITYVNDVPLPHADTYNLSVPRSSCPHCGHKITALENIPVLSYLVLKGKCSACKAPISPRYPIIEALAGALSAFLIWRFGSGLAGLSALVFTYFLIAMTFIDADTKLLPDNLTLPLMWLGLLVNIPGTFTSLPEAVIGAVAGYLVLWSVAWLFKRIRGQEGMGNGDFKLLAALGAWLGWKMLPVVILLSSVVGAVVGITLILFFRRARDNPIPFGPYLAAAGLIALLYGKSLTQVYLNI